MQGTDGYPKTNKVLDEYYIGGGECDVFEPIAIEIYGVK